MSSERESYMPPLKTKSLKWTRNDHQFLDRNSDSEETIMFEPDDDSKIKPEVELKEDADNYVYKADFRGHLQLVSIAHRTPNHCSNIENNQQDELANLSAVALSYKMTNEEEQEDKFQATLNNRCQLLDAAEKWSSMKSALHTSEDGQQVIISWQEESESSCTNQVYREMKNMAGGESYYVKEESLENNVQACSYVHALPEIYDYSSDSTWEPQTDNSSRLTLLSNNISLNGNMTLLTQAEKKRLYRLRIKEENPDMWSSIKKREAARKREQREKRRQIIFEMQKAMELVGLPDSPEVVNQRLYLEALKERYPELWGQLISALPATQIRNEQLYSKRNAKSHRNMPKPAKIYKDVIEAQKKRLYRQRVRQERPEMYERQKARDAYARSIQRLMLRKKQFSEKNDYADDGFSFPSEATEKKLTYLNNLEMDDTECLKSKTILPDFSGECNTLHVECNVASSPCAKVPSPAGISDLSLIPISDSLPPAAAGDIIAESDPSHVCDNSQSEDSYRSSKNSSISSDSNISDGDKTKECSQDATTFPKNLSAACSTQSDILWFWNDEKSTEMAEGVPPTYVSVRRGPQVLTEEERLQKILKERMRLKERRLRHRMNMSPEQRIEFLEVERERLKAYRLKKKAADAATSNSTQNEFVSVGQ